MNGERLKIFVFSADAEITAEVEDYAEFFSHKVIDCSEFFASCMPDLIHLKPDVIVCASEIRDINTGALIQILNRERKLSECAVVAVQHMHERYMYTKYTAFSPFELFSFERMIRIAIEEKRSKRQPVHFLPEEKKMRQRITNLLHRLGMSSDLDGYRFAHQALVMAMDDLNNIRNLSKNIYPAISKKYGVSEKYVDRMITSAINSSWLKCPIEVQQEIFGNSVSYCPSSKVYLATLTEYLYNDTDEPLLNEAAHYNNYIY